MHSAVVTPLSTLRLPTKRGLCGKRNAGERKKTAGTVSTLVRRKRNKRMSYVQAWTRSANGNREIEKYSTEKREFQDERAGRMKIIVRSYVKGRTALTLITDTAAAAATANNVTSSYSTSTTTSRRGPGSEEGRRHEGREAAPSGMRFDVSEKQLRPLLLPLHCNFTTSVRAANARLLFVNPIDLSFGLQRVSDAAGCWCSRRYTQPSSSSLDDTYIC